MDINNVNKYNTNSFLQTKNRTNLNNNQFEEKLNNIFNKGSNKSSKADEYIPSKELNETNSNIVVNADGSRVLMITMIIGGMETSMSIEISKPTELQNNVGSMLEKDTVQLQQTLETVEGDAGN